MRAKLIQDRKPLPNTVGDDWRVNNISWMLVLGTLLVQARNLEALSAPGIFNEDGDLQDSSCHGTNEHQRCRSQFQQRKMPD